MVPPFNHVFQYINIFSSIAFIKYTVLRVRYSFFSDIILASAKIYYSYTFNLNIMKTHLLFSLKTTAIIFLFF
ncbi:MAG TPA: hypothetical protein VI461_09570, partial [Chitinophagaceae bacterium]|nr:hypothetical protein [Chitinophagaceae bacterium]